VLPRVILCVTPCIYVLCVVCVIKGITCYIFCVAIVFIVIIHSLDKYIYLKLIIYLILFCLIR